MKSMIALKSFSYATRRLMPGQAFQASSQDARLLVAIKKAREEREPSAIAPPPAQLVAKIASTTEDLKLLRAEYERVVGKKPFAGWKADELRTRMAAVAK